MDKILNCQMSMFGQFLDMGPKTDVIIKLLEFLKEDNFLPGSTDIPYVNIGTGEIKIESRMQMMSYDKTWTINFLPDRIDFNYNFQKGTDVYIDILKLIEYGKNLVEKTFEAFEEINGNRLALNCKLLLDSMAEEERNQFCKRFAVPLKIYQDSSFAEWSVRYNSRDVLLVSENKDENCNRIVEIAQTENLDGDDFKQDIVLTIDVNTLASNISQRFNYNNLLFFSKSAANFIVNVINEIEGE